MIERKSNKVFIIIIGLLVIANITTLSLFYSGKRNDDYRKNIMRKYLKNEIKLDEAQLKMYDSFNILQHKNIRALYDEFKKNKRANLKKAAQASFSDSAILSAAQTVAAEQERIEIKILQNLREIRNICTSSQQAAFDTGFYKIISGSRRK